MGKDGMLFMKEKGWYKQLIMPQLGLNAGTIYSHQVVGCRPESMVRDCHLIKTFIVTLTNIVLLHKIFLTTISSSSPYKH